MSRHARLWVFALVASAAFILANADAEADPLHPDCSKSTLTPAKFSELYHTIAMHGDLTDIPFIEKTLQVKFRSQPSIEGDGKIDTYRTIYRTDSIFGTPAEISLDVNLDHEQQREYQTIALRAHLARQVVPCVP